MGRVKSDDLNFTALSCCFQFFRETALPWGKAVPGSQAHCVSPQKRANLAPAKSAEAEYTECMFTNYSGSKLAFQKSCENKAVRNSFNLQVTQYHYCTLKNVLRFYWKSCQVISRASKMCWTIELDYFYYFANQSARRQDSPPPKQTCQAAVVVVPRSAAKNRVGHLWFGFLGSSWSKMGNLNPWWSIWSPKRPTVVHQCKWRMR